MTAFLQDVNVLIALVDPAHVQHEAAHEWFAREGRCAWAIGPLTENGLLRIPGNPRYPNSLGTPSAVLPILSALCALPGHVFWPDDLSLRDAEAVDADRLSTPAQLTDSHLPALASARQGRLASFDRRLVVDAVRGGAPALHIV